jgi:hypothetical protein
VTHDKPASSNGKDFFISYNSADKQWGEWIAWQLEEQGHSVMIQAWDFRPGENFGLKMHEAASEATYTIAVLSDDYLKAAFTQPEWVAAFVQDPKGEQRKLIPIRVKECNPNGLLKAIIYIDLVGLTEQEARARLLEGLQERAKPTEAPGFPDSGTTRPTSERVFPHAVPYPLNISNQVTTNVSGQAQVGNVVNAPQGTVHINEAPKVVQTVETKENCSPKHSQT